MLITMCYIQGQHLKILASAISQPMSRAQGKYPGIDKLPPSFPGPFSARYLSAIPAEDKDVRAAQEVITAIDETAEKVGDDYTPWGEAEKAEKAETAEQVHTASQPWQGPRVPLNGWQQAAVAVGAAVGAALDPSRADLVAAVGETTGSLAFQRILGRMRSHPEGQVSFVSVLEFLLYRDRVSVTVECNSFSHTFCHHPPGFYLLG
jgi:hypothetical protein